MQEPILVSHLLKFIHKMWIANKWKRQAEKGCEKNSANFSEISVRIYFINFRILSILLVHLTAVIMVAKLSSNNIMSAALWKPCSVDSHSDTNVCNFKQHHLCRHLSWLQIVLWLVRFNYFNFCSGLTRA
jgi:hypothetical protein